MLRTPAELSDGQRYRFRLALAVARRPRWIVADEFTANLDRTLAQVIAYNLAKVLRRREIGLLAATTLTKMSRPICSPICMCRDGWTDRRSSLAGRKKKSDQFCRRGLVQSRGCRRLAGLRSVALSLAPTRTHPRDLRPLACTTTDRHLRLHVPSGVPVATQPVLRTRGTTLRVKLQALNRQLVLLSRVVLHPTYRGAGLAAAFVRAACRACRWPWIETLAEMGHLHPFFEHAGFVRVGVTGRHRTRAAGHSAIWGARRGCQGRQRLVSNETFEKSRYAQPVYYIFDNRQAGAEESVAPVDSAGGARWRLIRRRAFGCSRRTRTHRKR